MQFIPSKELAAGDWVTTTLAQLLEGLLALGNHVEAARPIPVDRTDRLTETPKRGKSKPRDPAELESVITRHKTLTEAHR